MNISYLFLLKNSIFRNEQYTTGGDSWKQFWEDTTGDTFGKCVVCELDDAVLGGHVSGLGFHGVGIVPLCIGCNNLRGLEMKTRIDTKMACVTKKEIDRILGQKQEALDKFIDKLLGKKKKAVPIIDASPPPPPPSTPTVTDEKEDDFVHVPDETPVPEPTPLEPDTYYKTTAGKSGKFHLRYNCYGAKLKVVRKNVKPSKICKDCVTASQKK